MLKNLTFLALLTAPAFATNSPLTITPIQLDTGNAYINWSEDYAQLTSWELSFTLTVTTSVDECDIFRTLETSNSSPYLLLHITQDGSLQIGYKEKSWKETEQLLINQQESISLGKKVNITLSFINNSSIRSTSGFLSLAVNSKIESVELQDSNHINAAIWKKSNNSGFITTNNGNTVLDDIKLYMVDMQGIPEPTTSTFSLIGLLALLAKRKRK